MPAIRMNGIVTAFKGFRERRKTIVLAAYRVNAPLKLSAGFAGRIMGRHFYKIVAFLLGEIACGEPIWADEDRESYVMADTDIKADFCLTAKGDSMINARIYDGDVVFIKQMPMVENGEIAAVIIDNEATLKRVYYYPEIKQAYIKS